MSFYINIFFVLLGIVSLFIGYYFYDQIAVHLGFYLNRRSRSLDFFLVTLLPDRVVPVRYIESKKYSI